MRIVGGELGEVGHRLHVDVQGIEEQARGRAVWATVPGSRIESACSGLVPRIAAPRLLHDSAHARSSEKSPMPALRAEVSP
jgi:hypothetical protein